MSYIAYSSRPSSLVTPGYTELFHNSHAPRLLLLVWLAVLLAMPLAALLVAGETDVRTGITSGDQVWAEIHGTRIDVPKDSLAGINIPDLELPGMADLRIEPASSSLYWQPVNSNFFPIVGLAGEWLEAVRPPAEWTSAQLSGGVANYGLKGGRSLAMLPLRAPSGKGFALLVRPERATISWWTLDGDKALRELASASYRPAGVVSLGDLLSEVALVTWTASLFGLLALLAGGGLALLVQRRNSSTRTYRRRRGIARTGLSRLVRPWHPAIALFIAGTILSSVISIVVLDGIPHVQDDVAYLFQGKIFAEWRSWVPAPPAPEFFQSGFVQMYEGRWFSKYPPGYPLLLVPGIWAGMPWLINALSTGVALALIYAAGIKMFGRHVAAWAGLLGLISPWLLFMSGSYMSHPTTMMWAALFLYALVRLHLSFDTCSSSRFAGVPVRWGLVAGFAIGMAFITREWTALGIGVGAGLWALGDIVSARRRFARKLLSYSLVLAGFLPPLLFLLYQNRQLTGDWFRLAQDLVGSYDRPGFGPGYGSALGHTPAMGLYNALVYLRTLATVFDGWPAPFALAPLFLGLLAWMVGVSRRLLAWDLLLWLPLAGLVAAYFAWWSSTTIYGPRYWYEGMPFMLLTSGRGLDLLGRLASSALEGNSKPLVRWLAPATVCVLFGAYTMTQALPVQAASYLNYNDISVDPLREVQEAHLTGALIFTALEPSRPNRDYGKVFFANDPLLRGDSIFVRDRGAEANRYLASLFAGRTPYFLPLSGPPHPGVGP